MEEQKEIKEQKEEELQLPKFNFKIRKEKLPLLLICLILIFGSLVYIKFFCHQIDTITYPDGCKEVYIDNKLNGTVECNKEQLMNKRVPTKPNFNFTMT
jgi:hypothetical protein